MEKKQLIEKLSKLTLEERAQVLGIALYLKRNLKEKLMDSDDIFQLVSLEHFINNDGIEFFQNIRDLGDDIFEGNREVSFLIYELCNAKESFIINEILKNEDYYNSNNYSTPKELSQLVIKYCKYDGYQKILDLYAGRGNFEVELWKSCENMCIGNNVNAYEVNSTMFYYSEMTKYAVGLPVNFIQKDILLGQIDGNEYDIVFADTPNINYPIERLKFINEQIKNTGIQLNENRKVNIAWITSLLAIEKMAEQKSKGIVKCFNSCLNNILDKDVRKSLIEKNYIEAIIELPEKIVPYTSNPMSLIVLSKDKKNNDIKIIDLKDCYKAERRRNILDVDKALQYIESGEKTSKLSVETIKKNEYSLNPLYYNDSKKYMNQEGVELKEVKEDLFRGYQITASQADKMIVDSIEDSNYQILEAGNIDENGEMTGKLKMINTKGKNLDRYLLKDGDIVISAKGDKTKKCIIHIENENQKIIPNGSLNVIRVNQEKILPTYLKIFLSSEKGTILLNSLKTGNTIPVISFSSLEKMKIPCPSLEEQLKLTDEYESQLQVIKLAKMNVTKLEDELTLIINKI